MPSANTVNATTTRSTFAPGFRGFATSDQFVTATLAAGAGSTVSGPVVEPGSYPAVFHICTARTTLPLSGIFTMHSATLMSAQVMTGLTNAATSATASYIDVTAVAGALVFTHATAASTPTTITITRIG